MSCSVELSSQMVSGYSSASQAVRVATEAWARQCIACLACGGELYALPANTPVRDFDCQGCGEAYQLKAKSGGIGNRILGAAYSPTLASFRAGNYPSLILLGYDREAWVVANVEVVFRGALTESCLVARKPLGPNARRAGWQGCTIVLDLLPATARVTVLQNGVWSEPETIRTGWREAARMFTGEHETRGWAADVLRVVEALHQRFALADVYEAEAELAALHPGNRNVRAKIRQQLQVLRDRGAIRFVRRGEYERLAAISVAYRNLAR